MNTFLQAEFHITLENIRNNLSSLCKLYDVKHSQSGSRIILPSVGRKDTSPNLAYKILQYGLNLFLNQKETSNRIFLGGDIDDDPAGYSMSKCKTLSNIFGSATVLGVKMLKVSTFLLVKAYLVLFLSSKYGLLYVFYFDLLTKPCSYILPFRQPVVTAIGLQTNFEQLLLKIFQFLFKVASLNTTGC